MFGIARIVLQIVGMLLPVYLKYRAGAPEREEEQKHEEFKEGLAKKTKDGNRAAARALSERMRLVRKRKGRSAKG